MEKQMELKEFKIRDEAELESLLISKPEQIEKDFIVLSNQRSTSQQKRLDIIGVDINGTLTIIELKVVTDPMQLSQSLEYYSWVMEQGLDWFSNAYKEKLKNRTIEDNMPQIFLIAPDFTSNLKNEIKFIRKDITVRLFRYIPIEIENAKFIKLIEERIEPLKEIMEKPWKLSDNLSYISNDEIKKLFKESTEKVKTFEKENIEEKIGKLVISYWINGLKFCEFYPKKEYFAVGYKTDELDTGWTWQTEIADEKIFDDLMNTKLKYAFNLMKSKKGK